MIFDNLARASRYAGLGNTFQTALTYLVRQDFSTSPIGRSDLQGDELYAMLQEFTTKPFDQGVWEAHRRYIDVHYVISGQEKIFFAPIETMQPGEYLTDKDFLPLKGTGSPLVLSKGFFVIFYPEDAHMPGLQVDAPELVRKVVLKIKVPGTL